MAVLRCPYCDSTNLVVFKVKYWKCQDCGHIVIKPTVMPDSVSEPAAETAKTE